MRKANMNDTFNLARLITEIGVKKELFDSVKDTNDVQEVGFNMIFTLFEKATTENSEHRLYECLSKPFEMSPEEVGLLQPMEFIKGISTCYDIPQLINFIKRAV